MTNKQIQLDILNNASELISLCKEFKHLEYKQNTRQITNDEETRLILLQSQLNAYPNDYIKNAFNIAHSQQNKKTKLQNKIKKLLSLKEKYVCDVLFITMTFNDNVLNSTTKKTRKTYIARYLKENFVSYIANIDFGEDNQREHYHAIAISKNSDYITLQANYAKIAKNSAIKIKQVYYKNSDIRIAKYITKLSSHAFKETTKREHILYSKNDLEKINQLEFKNKIEYEIRDNMIIVKDNEPLPFEARTPQQQLFDKQTKLQSQIATEWKKYCKEKGIKKDKHIPKDLIPILKDRAIQSLKIK